MNEFCAKKGIKREYTLQGLPQQNGLHERKKRTLIEAARNYASNSLLPIQFWAEAVNYCLAITAFEEEKNIIALANGKKNVANNGVFSTNSFDDEHSDTEEDGPPDYNNKDHTIDVSSTPTYKIHKIHPQSHIIGQKTNHKDQQTCLFACFLSQEEPKKVSQALADESIHENDIIFGATNLLCEGFWKRLMQKESKDDTMGELTCLFLGLKSSKLRLHKKSLVKDKEGEEVEYNLLVTPKVSSSSHLHAVKRIFRRSTSGGCQYLGRRLVSWQCKKQTIVAISSTEAEYVAAASCCAQVLWMQNQLLDYGFNFMNTDIHIDNESTICIVRNPVLHSKTKHIQIRHHFIRDCYEQRLINVVKVHTDDIILIGPWLQQFWATASLRVINEVPHIRATVAGKKVLISEETIRADLLFDDADGVDCFPKQVIWDSLRDIGYEGNLAQLTFSKPLFSPQWKYLVHVLLHCLSPKSTSWEQFGTNIASALVGLATNQKFNFSLMIMNGMLGHISNGTPFLMAKSSPRDAQGTPTQSAAQDSSLQGTANLQGTAEAQATADSQGTAATLGKLGDSRGKPFLKLNRFSSSRPKSRNCPKGHYVQEDYTADHFFEDIVDKDAAVTSKLERKNDETEERKSDETEEVLIEEKREASDVKSPSSPIRPTQEEGSEEQFKVDEVLADISLDISRPRGLSIPGPIRSQPQQPTQATDPKDKGKGILVEEPKKKKLTL
ncbi:putative ribonuclease H-like domain-containing protein [Tanacetum coccineum]